MNGLVPALALIVAFAGIARGAEVEPAWEKGSSEERPTEGEPVQTEPVEEDRPEPLRPPWEVELLVVAQPDQDLEISCNRGVDCKTPVRASFGGAFRAGFRDPGEWGLDATMGLVHALDQEQIPVNGYSVLTLRIDVQLEFGRTTKRFGAALRMSPILAYGWHDDGSAWATDIPGFAFLLGRTDLWGEVSVPPMPTPADPRLFHLAVGWTHPRISGIAGFGTFGTLGYQRNELDLAGGKLGLFAHLETPLTERFRITLRLNVSTPISVALGFATTLGKAR